MSNNTIGILGGSGFVGRHLTRLLSAQGYNVHIISRHTNRLDALKVLPEVTLFNGDPHDPDALSTFTQDLDVVINLVGILNEKKDNGEDFHRAHVELNRKILHACQSNGVKRLLHMSALNASPEANSYYLRSKGVAEHEAHQAAANGLQVTSFRPSVIFGWDDSFFNRFAGLLRLTPLMFPLACAQSRFAPVFVDDVAHAFLTALENRETIGKRYDLCGPSVYTLKQLVSYTADCLGLHRTVIGLPDIVARLQAHILGRFPGRPFTMDNYRSLQQDSVCQDNGFKHLDIQPTQLESVVPGYLGNQTGRKERLNKNRMMQTYSVSNPQQDKDSDNK
jgi:NADH dehydrogenase